MSLKGTLSEEKVDATARDVGLDLEKLKVDMAAPKVDEQISGHYDAGPCVGYRRNSGLRGGGSTHAWRGASGASESGHKGRTPGLIFGVGADLSGANTTEALTVCNGERPGMPWHPGLLIIRLRKGWAISLPALVPGIAAFLASGVAPVWTGLARRPEHVLRRCLSRQRPW